MRNMQLHSPKLNNYMEFLCFNSTTANMGFDSLTHKCINGWILLFRVMGVWTINHIKVSIVTRAPKVRLLTFRIPFHPKVVSLAESQGSEHWMLQRHPPHLFTIVNPSHNLPNFPMLIGVHLRRVGNRFLVVGWEVKIYFLISKEGYPKIQQSTFNLLT